MHYLFHSAVEVPLGMVDHTAKSLTFSRINAGIQSEIITTVTNYFCIRSSNQETEERLYLKRA